MGKAPDGSKDGCDILQERDPWLVQTTKGNRPVSLFPPPGFASIEKIEPKRSVSDEELDFVEQTLSDSAEACLPEPSKRVLANARARKARVPWMPKGKGCGCCSAGPGLDMPLAPPEGQLFFETKPMPDVSGARFNFGLFEKGDCILLGGPPGGT